MKTCFRPLLFFAALVASASGPLHAQTNVSDIVGFLMTNQAVPTDDLERDRAASEAAADVLRRALTPGHGRTSFGVSGSTSDFNNLDGHILSDGSFVAIARQFRDEPAPFDVESLTLHMRSS